MSGGSSGLPYDYGKPVEGGYRHLEINILNLCMKICKVAEAYYKENEYKFDFFEYELIDK